MKDFLKVIAHYEYWEIFDNSAILRMIVGVLISIWLSATFMTALDKSIDNEFIVEGIRNSHYALVGVVFICLDKREQYLLLPWIQLKILENIACWASTSWYLTMQSNGFYNFFIYIGLINMILNMALIRSMWNTFTMLADYPPEYEEEPIKQSETVVKY